MFTKIINIFKENLSIILLSTLLALTIGYLVGTFTPNGDSQEQLKQAVAENKVEMEKKQLNEELDRHLEQLNRQAHDAYLKVQDANTAPFEKLILTGKNNFVSEPLQMSRGLYVFNYTYFGVFDFDVDVLDKNGQRDPGVIYELVPNTRSDEAQKIIGSSAYTIDQSGEYFLDINSKGDWQIEITKK